MMHRRGGNKFRGGNSNYRFHDDHDNRTNNFIKTSRRVSFKTTKNNNAKSLSDMKIKAFLDDEDMGNDLAQNTSNDMKKKGRFRNRKGSPVPNRRIGGMNLIQNHAGWYLVTIHHGSKYEKDVLLKLLMNALLPTVFNAHYYKIDTENSCAQFYVDDYDIAAKILTQDKKLNLPDGFKMIIRVRGSVPHVKVDETLKERMKLAMVKRYNPQTKALDLTKFHADQDLSDVFCALFRPQIMSAVISIIVENIPDLEALNLNENKLNMFDHLKILSSKLHHLKIIYLANNRIGSLSSLEVFKHLPIVEFYLEGNPFKKRFAKNGDYVSEVKKKFPKLLKLDGVELSPTIGFDVSEEKKDFPIWKQSFMVNSSGQDFVAKFLEQYFAIYDSENRQQLLEAYHENAMLSITSTNNQHYTYEERLHAYWKVGRNLIHPKGYEHRFASLKRGKLVVVAMLSDLPPTKHDPQSFAVDLTFYTVTLYIFRIIIKQYILRCKLSIKYFFFCCSICEQHNPKKRSAN
ncbi:unnamed protein product [Chironomus riparius]|uniref:NTF2 domain-containing protein n=1 Tax=Chironomus riparius TaxID=315576 RepID=A0A9P0NF03_9DIPT|nr:unnamed protein product [Chironomus riparius]